MKLSGRLRGAASLSEGAGGWSEPGTIRLVLALS